jgi:hypothetical protein
MRKAKSQSADGNYFHGIELQAAIHLALLVGASSRPASDRIGSRSLAVKKQLIVVQLHILPQRSPLSGLPVPGQGERVLAPQLAPNAWISLEYEDACNQSFPKRAGTALWSDKPLESKTRLIALAGGMVTGLCSEGSGPGQCPGPDRCPFSRIPAAHPDPACIPQPPHHLAPLLPQSCTRPFCGPRRHLPVASP